MLLNSFARQAEGGGRQRTFVAAPEQLLCLLPVTPVTLAGDACDIFTNGASPFLAALLSHQVPHLCPVFSSKVGWVDEWTMGRVHEGEGV